MAIAASSFERQAAVHAFRGVPQGRAAGAWEAHAASRWTAAATATARDMHAHTRSQPVDLDDFGETIARFAAPAERSFLERRSSAELQMRRSALMTREVILERGI